MISLQLSAGTIESGGEEIYWELTSSGPDDDRAVVVLSHGAGGSHAVWFQQVPVLGQAFRVLTWDSRGFGNSTLRGPGPNPEQAAADIEAVLDHLGVDGAHFIGQSMGGWHISALAAAAPERVLSLVYADTIGGLWTDELREAFAAFQAEGGLVRPGPTIVGGHPALWSRNAERDPALAFLYQQLGSFFSAPMSRLGDTIAWSIDHETITAMDVPVLFVAGTHDNIFPAAALANSAALLPRARYVEIPDAGHSPYFEQPEAWNDAVGFFLREAAGETAATPNTREN